MADSNSIAPAPASSHREGPSPYYAMVVDSGPIIKQDVRNLMGKANSYYITPTVLREIRDSKAREYLEHSVMPLLDLQVREPSDKAIQDVIAFAKQTGDYASLSTVDLQVLALTLDLEREGNLVNGNTDLEHIRTTPKRKIGLGSILPMNNKSGSTKTTDAGQEEKKGEDGDAAPVASDTAQPESTEQPKLLGREDYDEVEDSDESDDEEDDNDSVQEAGDEVDSKEEAATVNVPSAATVPTPPVRKTWATLVNPTAAATPLTTPGAPSLSFAAISLGEKKATNDDDNDGGQFDDASDDAEDNNATSLEDELQTEFPSLLAAATVPYEGEDDEIENGDETPATENGDNEVAAGEKAQKDQENPHKKKASVFMTEEEKQKNLQPLSKSGRVYNSFRKYKGLMKPKPTKKVEIQEEEKGEAEETSLQKTTNEMVPTTQQQSSRFLGGGGGGETMKEEDDDGVGWITSADDIKFMKNEGGGRLDPGKTGGLDNQNSKPTNKNTGPPASFRTACATTDFAMQNVLLQMNLILMSTDGMRIRRLKSWVIRCGACFKIHGADEDFKDETHHHMKRLFCSHCGSGDMMQRISASVDGKTGRLKLHFSRRKQGRHHSIRGTKFSLPKPGSGNKYKGDLLLREDQLLSGAWNQKVKINSGKKYQTSRSQSMFGRDIAASVGCNVRSTSTATFGGKGWSTTANTSANGGFGSNNDDIRVGFGARKNPNAAKGRERRGKKKKSSDRACGMRRY
jgi:RNA-binding protein NOB1